MATAVGYCSQRRLVETVEIIEDSAGYDKIHLGLMSSNKPDITFIEYTDPVEQWRFNDSVIEGKAAWPPTGRQQLRAERRRHDGRRTAS